MNQTVPGRAELTPLRLLVRSQDGLVQRVCCPLKAEILIGRDASADVVLRSPEVSRRHLILAWEDGRVRCTDVSANGTGVENRVFHRASELFDPGASFLVGPFVVQIEPAASAVAAAPNGAAPAAAPLAAIANSAAVGAELPFADQSTGVVGVGGVGGVGAEASAAVAAGLASLAQAPVSASSVAPVSVPASIAPVVAPALAAVPATKEAQSPEAIADSEPTSGATSRGTSDVAAATRREIHRQLLDNLDLAKLERGRMNARLLRSKVHLSLEGIVGGMTQQLPAGTDLTALVGELTDEALGLGPLEAFLADPAVTEIMVVDPRVIYVERDGKIELTDSRFTDDESVRSVLERIVTPLGRRIDESSPMLDARLADGSRVNAVIPPLAIRGTCITIRKFPLQRWGQSDLLRFGTLNERMATFLERCVATRKNILVSGGTGSGKTTLLNILSTAISPNERIVTIEDSAELRLNQPHVIPLEARPANMEGRGAITIRDLVKNAMRMRPDRILVGECRGGEALDMLQAMNTGHDGSMTTTHANSPFEALKRIETLVLMAGLDLPSRAIREQISASVDILVQQTRLPDGSRKIVSIAEVTGLDDDGELTVREIFGFRREGMEEDGTVIGQFYTTGYLPSFIADFIVQGLVPAQGGVYL